jgi:uncharacterized repeat protein (TIGR04002 family)
VKVLSKHIDEKIKLYAVSAIFAAIIMVTTAFIKIPGPFGFMHIGDAVIFIAASLLPVPLAAAASAIGAASADLIAGYPMYIIPTIIIKILMTLTFIRGSKAKKIVDIRNIVAVLSASVIGIVGYFLADLFLYGNGAVMSLPFNILQEAAGMVIYIVFGITIDKSGLKKLFKTI